jgi:hypothetical protein
MQLVVRQISELVFTAYLMPALLLPVVWTAGALARRAHAPAVGDRGPALWFRLHGGAAALLIAGWALAACGVPIERGGAALTAAAWLVFATLQLSFAALASSVTTHVSKVPEGRDRDVLFAAFVGFTLLQPVGTAAGLAVLFRLMRLVYHQTLPLLDIVPEGV